MKLKVIQVNIYKGRYLNSLINFLKAQYADIVFMQEVSCGFANLYEDRSINLFEYVKRAANLEGIFYPIIKITDKPNSFEGNAVFSSLPIINSRLILLKDFSSIYFDVYKGMTLSPEFPRGIVEATLDINGVQIYAMSCHGAWSQKPVDTPEKIRQAKLIAKHLKELDLPFIMGADMNMPLETRVIKTVEKSSKNLMRNSRILQTTHPTVHKIAPRGLLVDYIFTSGHFKKISIAAPNVLVSDHLPLVCEVELKD